MATLQIPLSDVPDESFTMILEGKSYDFRIIWNTRDESWYIQLGLQNQPPRFTTKLTTGSNVIRPYRAYEDTPNGVLLAVDLLKSTGRLQRDSFSSGRFILVYITSDEMEALQNAAIDAIDRSGIIRVDQDARFFKTADPLSGIPFDGVFVS